MSQAPHQERTFVMFKPDTVQRSLVGELYKRIERTGLKCVGLKMLIETDEKKLFEHYNKDDDWFMAKGTRTVEDLKNAGLPVEKEPIEYGKDLIRANAIFMMQGPVVAMVFEGNQAAAVVKKIVGSTEPSTSDVGTIRGDYTIDSYAHSSYEDRAVRNLVHCTDPEDGPQEAEREINLWFKPEELLSYTTAQEAIMYDVNLDGKAE